MRFSDFRDQDLDAFDFRQIDVDLQQYVPWLQGYRVLALRAAATMTEGDAPVTTCPSTTCRTSVVVRGSVDSGSSGFATGTASSSPPSIAGRRGGPSTWLCSPRRGRATFVFDSGNWLPIGRRDLEQWFRDQPRNPDGTFRAPASRYIQGTPVGQFRHYGTRSDDPNDLYPHESRRELRGYKVLSAWLNHDDSRSLNTFDAYVEDNGRRYVRHHECRAKIPRLSLGGEQ